MYINITESKRKQDNRDRLNLMSPSVRDHVEVILINMENRGYLPLIDAQIYRTPEQQAALVAKGYSKVKYSFHNVTDGTSTPAALAADIIDIRWGWNAPKRFWQELAFCAEEVGMTTGIYWGLSWLQRISLGNLIKKQEWDEKAVLGWDVAHVEPKGISVTQAKYGKRPSLPPIKPPTPPVKLILNDKVLKRATWDEAGFWIVSYKEVGEALGRTGPGDVTMSIREALDRLGYKINKIGDHRKTRQRFYVYAIEK